MTLTARFPGRCWTCRGAIAPGEAIEWDKATKRTTHTRCDPAAAAKRAKAVAAVVESRAVDVAADVEIPIAEGLSYLPFQRAGVAYAMARVATLIADEMGLGKTVQAIGVINADATIRRVLVICPASLRLNWRRELSRFLARPMTCALADSATWPESDVMIVTWDSAAKLRALIDAVAWDLVIVDEAHYGKTPTSARSKAVFGREAKGKGASRIEGDPGIKARRKIALTGTPITNRPAERELYT